MALCCGLARLGVSDFSLRLFEDCDNVQSQHDHSRISGLSFMSAVILSVYNRCNPDVLDLDKVVQVVNDSSQGRRGNLCDRFGINSINRCATSVESSSGQHLHLEMSTSHASKEGEKDGNGMKCDSVVDRTGPAQARSEGRSSTHVQEPDVREFTVPSSQVKMFMDALRGYSTSCSTSQSSAAEALKKCGTMRREMEALNGNDVEEGKQIKRHCDDTAKSILDEKKDMGKKNH